MVEVHLYGRLRRYGPTTNVREACVIRVEHATDQRTVEDFVASLGIPTEEVASVFLDGRWDFEGLKRPLRGITRLGLFPRNMTLLYI